MKLVAYEGSLVAIPSALPGSNTTTGLCIAANRDHRFGTAMAVDILDNWAALDGSEFNFFDLSGPYGADPPPWSVFQWGLTEDLHNTTTAKLEAIQAMLAL
jgi:hypothetical protein